MMRTIIGRVFVAAATVAVFFFVMSAGRDTRDFFVMSAGRDTEGSGSSSAPRSIEFKELVLDAQARARAATYVEVIGVYQGLSADFELIYPPAHTALSMGDNGIR